MKKYLLQMSGSVAVAAVSCAIHGATDQEAIEAAKARSKDMAGGNYYRFDLWADEKQPPIARWRVEMIATVIGEA